MTQLRILAAVLACAGCPAGAPAQKIQPDVPTVGQADSSMKGTSIEACAPGDRHDVMVVDWTPEMRGDLEVAMKEGLALLAYDCRSAKLVPACSLGGAYGYIGTTRREKTVQLDSADEVAANLPVGGLSWLSDASVKVGRESALLAQLVMVGKRSSAKKVAQRDELEGGCENVTHFVRAATVGAFVVAAGSKAELSGGLKVMGKGASAGAKSSTKIASKDGEVEACQAAAPDQKSPPDQCGALMRIELEPIGAGVATASGGDTAATDAQTAADLAVASCAPGFAMSAGTCVRTSKPHQCKPGDGSGCAAQCEAGNAESCAILAVMHREGRGVDKDARKASTLAKRACDKDNLLGCRTYAALQLGKDASKAIELLDRGCNAGDGASCVQLGVARLDKKLQPNDAQYAFRRACYGGGEHEGCTWIGILYAEGKGGLGPNAKLAVPFLEKGCKEGSMRGCHELAGVLSTGKGGVKKDATRAKELRAQACKGGYAPACKK